jgi:hypothetical protein
MFMTFRSKSLYLFCFRNYRKKTLYEFNSDFFETNVKQIQTQNHKKHMINEGVEMETKYLCF